MKKLIQIGLCETCEYLYVSYPNWTDLKESQINPEFPFIPEELWDNGEPWFYIGVEMFDKHVKYISENINFKECHDRATILTKCITSTDEIWVQHSGWAVGEGDYQVKGTSLNTLFAETGVPNVLVMNIENSEGHIFDFYDFAYKPDLIIVHIHSHWSLQIILKRMLENGYELLAMPYATTDILVCSFMRSHLVSERLHGIWCWG